MCMYINIVIYIYMYTFLCMYVCLCMYMLAMKLLHGEWNANESPAIREQILTPPAYLCVEYLRLAMSSRI